MQARMFSRRDDAVIGSFHHGHAVVEANHSPETIEVIKDRSLIGKHADKPDVLFKVLLEYSSILHERLHYLDTFGTLGGLSMFNARMAVLRRFIQASGDIVVSKGLWKLPLSKWVASGAAPDVARRLLRLARAFRTGTDAFLAPFGQFAQRGHTTEPWIDVPFPSMDAEGRRIVSNMPAFPMSVTVVTGDTQDTHPLTIVQPMGYESIVEGIAHGASRSLIHMTFPDLPATMLEHYGPPKMFVMGAVDKDLDAVARRYEIYTASDLMISKYLRGKGFPTFPRDLVFRLSDLSLSLSYLTVADIADDTTRVEFRSPGQVLIDALTKADPADLAKGQIGYPDSVHAGYQGIHDQLAKQADWDTIAPRSLYTADRIWERFAAKHIVAPLIKKRIDSGGVIFNEEYELIQYAMSMDLPRIEVINGTLRFHGMPEEVRSAWGTQLFTSEIAQQVLADDVMLRCPRAHGLVPGMDRADFSGGNCAKHKKLGCGTFVPGQESHMPACLFSSSLRSLGFIPIESA